MEIWEQVEHVEKEKEEKLNQKKNKQEAEERKNKLFYKYKSICDPICDSKYLKEFFLSAIRLSHNQLWDILEGQPQ